MASNDEHVKLEKDEEESSIQVKVINKYLKQNEGLFNVDLHKQNEGLFNVDLHRMKGSLVIPFINKYR